MITTASQDREALLHLEALLYKLADTDERIARIPQAIEKARKIHNAVNATEKIDPQISSQPMTI